MRKLILIIAVMVMAGCVSRPLKVSQVEYDAMTKRTYNGVTKKQAFQAAENFFILLDGNDFDITYPRGLMVAVRPWLLGFSSGLSEWTIDANEVGTSTDVAVSVRTTFNTVPLKKNKVTYDVFWARMDYLLGKKKDWLTCDDVSNMFDKKETWGDDFAVCNGATLENNKPEQKHIVVKN